ncbi:MAG: PEGA domain-containing protein, partial [Candidatus Binatia bacterium]
LILRAPAPVTRQQVLPATAEADEIAGAPAGVTADTAPPPAVVPAAPESPPAETAPPSLAASSEPPPPRELAMASSSGAPPASSGAALEIASVPPGARISIDGQQRGVTPHRVTGLRSGRHRVVVEKPGYTSHSRTVDLGAHGSHELALTLNPTAAVLSVFSEPPGAAVHVNGKYRGKTPVRVEALATGAHDVAVELPGHVPYHKRMSLRAGEQRELRVGVSSAAERSTP